MGKIKNLLLKKGWSDDSIESLKVIQKRFFRINWLKTLYYNFKVLPLSQASRFPIIIGYNVKINKMGDIKIIYPATPGMISIGVIKIDRLESNTDKIIFSNYGKIQFGGRAKIHPGVRLVIYPHAQLVMGNRVLLGSMTKLICCKSITLGSDIRISWNCQVFDSDFHFLSNKTKGKIYQRTLPVIIENNTFVGNNVTIGKGTHLAERTVISCCSKVSGDFSQGGTGQLLTGNPAHCIGSGYEMTSGWFPEQEVEISRRMEE
jgi:acetyltransferase-like isoleucine patch superfamily enzyme